MRKNRRERPAALERFETEITVYAFQATGAIRGSPSEMKPLTTTNGAEELLRLA
jgi:hypothetical protein